MKNIEDIKNTPGLLIKKDGEDGFAGTIFDVNYKNGKIKIDSNIDNALHFIFSWGLRI